MDSCGQLRVMQFDVSSSAPSRVGGPAATFVKDRRKFRPCCRVVEVIARRYFSTGPDRCAPRCIAALQRVAVFVMPVGRCSRCGLDDPRADVQLGVPRFGATVGRIGNDPTADGPPPAPYRSSGPQRPRAQHPTPRSSLRQ